MGKPGPKPGSTLILKRHDTITEGDAIGVLLSNRPDRVWLDRADYERIVAAYGHRAWTWVKAARYVRIRPAPTENVPAARLVLESDGTGFIHFADGDRLNLRRKNLSVQPHREQYRVLKARPPGGWGRRLKGKVKKPVGVPRPFPEALAPLPQVSAFKLPERPPITVVCAVKRDRQR
ncbi:MAG: hypothetical protein WAP03_30575 [Methylorubrum rhodinum]|uniref:hypothetical protein n=1 Tax=Methylorubrum rhodinum TaxID=29428 RepID=UPI003BB0A01A